MTVEIEKRTQAPASNTPIQVKHLALADKCKTQWLNSILADAVQACRFERVPGIRILPLSGQRTRFSGSVDRWNYEWAVQLSISVGFWRKEEIISVYIHECAHLMVINEERARGTCTLAHGPVFFLTNLILCTRVDATCSLPRSLVRLIGLYDFQDSPLEGWPESEWRSTVINFAFKHYYRLAANLELSAEAVAQEAWKLWEIEYSSLMGRERERIAEIDKRKGLEKERDSLKARVNELERQRDVSFGWRFLFMTGWSGVFLSGFLALGVFTSAVVAVAYSIGLHRRLL